MSWKATKLSLSARHTKPTPEKCLTPLTPPVLSIQRCFCSHGQTDTSEKGNINLIFLTLCPPIPAVIPDKQFQQSHHSSKIPGTCHFTSNQQHRSAAPLHPVQPHGHNPKSSSFTMICPLLALQGCPHGALHQGTMEQVPTLQMMVMSEAETSCPWYCFFFNTHTHLTRG